MNKRDQLRSVQDCEVVIEDARFLFEGTSGSGQSASVVMSTGADAAVPEKKAVITQSGDVVDKKEGASCDAG